MNINEKLNSVEEKFNVAGSIPGVAIISGRLRSVAGMAQIIFGAIVGLTVLVGLIVTKNQELKTLGERSVEQIFHGFLNFFRGNCESALGMLIVGPLLLLAFQVKSENGFKPIYKYDAPTFQQIST